MGRDHSVRGIGTATAIALAGLAAVMATSGAFSIAAHAQISGGGDAYTAPEAPAAPPSRKKRTHDDAYSPPPEQRSYFPQTAPPAGGQPDGRGESKGYRGGDARGGDAWSPPGDRRGGSNDRGRQRAPAPSDVSRGNLPVAVEKGDLAPVMSSDGSGLPYELWRGLDVASIEALISTIEIPPRSPALHRLWKKLVTSQSGDSSNPDFTALRLEALYRSGLARAAAQEIQKQGGGAESPLLLTLEARNELASGRSDKACELVARSAHVKGAIPSRLKGQTIMMAGYCSAIRDDAASAGLAAEMAREEGVETSIGLEALDALSIKSKPKFTNVKQISLLDYRIAERVGGLSHKLVLEKGEPALLVALATDPTTPVDLGFPATEAAGRLNALTPETLAAIYRANAQAVPADELLAGRGPAGEGRRSALFKAAETERSPMRKTRLIRAFLDDCKHPGLGMICAEMIAPAAADVQPAPEASWFAETAIEVGLASGRYDLARNWISVGGEGGGNLEHWRALLAIADATQRARDDDLAALESGTVGGRFSPEALYRLTTVLEALNYAVPLPLWEAANKAPQPSTGYLPETGVLSQLQDAAKKQEFGRTVLLVMKALGPNGAADANLIALGDSIRALKQAGLEDGARKLGVEALLASWPRMATN
ncbi:hypothetical protein [Hyphomicrobium methylovorum]|uniref:hypothetical protein n=1 Tax=Hyphomicrobium methylovorum TaxID=84 RepID=UPI001FE80FAE|nr:hypothetical protein [Hyphomicrobium methylovorum]